MQSAQLLQSVAQASALVLLTLAIGLRVAVAAPQESQSGAPPSQSTLRSVDPVRVEPEGDPRIESVFEDRQGTVRLHPRSLGLIQVAEEPYRFTQTWWFFGLCLLGLLGLGLAACHFRVCALKKRQHMLSALMDERTQQLEAEKETVLAQAEALQALDNRKSRVFANISHEFRTPLTLTIGPLDDLKDGLYGPLPRPVIEQVELARRNAGRVLDLINQMLDVAHLEAGHVQLQARPVHLSALVTAAVQAFAPLADRRAITLSVQRLEDDAPPDADAVLWANPEQLQTILENLLSNALRFTPEGGRVRVTMDFDDDAARVAVRDSGPGIPAADLPHVFDRFYRSDADSPYEYAGAGFGLALAKELVDLHRGTLTVDSEEGFGSQFTVTLPCGHDHLQPDEMVDDGPPLDTFPEPGGDAAKHPAPGGDDASSLKNEADPDLDAEDVTTLLIVEDNAEMRGYIRKHLSSDYRLIEATNGREGLDRARTDLPDLVLSDVMMPEMDGVELCRALKETPETDFIPVILLTARAEIRDRISGLEEGADDYLTKPFDIDELRVRISNLIQSRQRLRERLSGPSLSIQAEAVSATSMDREFLDAVRATIESRLSDEEFTVDQLADAVGMSRVHLYRRLQDLLGESPSALVRSVRLERAAQLLAQRTGSVSEIAYSVGFKSVSHFSRVFREHYGHAPSKHPADAASE